MIQALRRRNKSLERRLTDLEAKAGLGAETQRLRREEVRLIVEEMFADAKQAMVPGWLQNLTFSGDLRLRYEGRNRSDPDTGDHDKRGRFRLRFGFVKTWPKDDLEIGFRLVTGADTDPTSTNQTFGNMFQEYGIGVDTAYAKWTPKAFKGFELWGGKFKNPWESTNIVWDTDVNPDGIWARYNVPGLGAVTPFVGAGVFQLRSADEASAAVYGDTGMAAYDAGVRWNVAKDVRYTLAVTHYRFWNLDVAFARIAAGTFPARGNNWFVNARGQRQFRAESFDEFDLVNKVDFKAFGLPFSVFTDWIHNCGDETDAPFAKRNDGFAAGVKVGQNKKKGDWSAGYTYRILQADTVLAFFPDGDFGYGSHTDRKGHEWNVTYNITDALTAGVNIFYTRPIDLNNEHRYVIQADLVWKF